MRGTAESTRGITLKALIVVIVLIGIAAALLYPVFAKMGSGAVSARCKNNLFKIGKALQLYANDFNEYVPPAEWYGPTGSVSWRESLQEFLGNDYPGAFKCAGKLSADVGYAVNFKAFGRNKPGMDNKNCWTMKQIKKPAQTIYILDTGMVTAETKHKEPEQWRETPENALNYCRCSTGDKYWVDDPTRPMPRHAKKVNCLMLDGVVKSYSVGDIVNPDEGTETCIWDRD